MENTKISIIVPVYNIAQELPRCLDSILAQTYDNLEIIAVDDGSKDASGEILDRYGAEHPQLVVIHQKNAGVTAARMHGISRATGAWIGFVDGDDCVEPDMFQRLYENAVKYEADISHCGYQLIFDDGRVYYYHNTGRLMQQDNRKGVTDLMDGSIVEPGLWNKLFKAKLFDGFEEKMDPSIKFNEDFLMNFLLFGKAERSVFEDICPYHYMARMSSATRQKMSDHRIFDPIRVREIIRRLAPEGVEALAQKAYVNSCLDACNGILVAGRKEYNAQFKKAQALLAAERARFDLMGKKRKLMAQAVLCAPGLYGVLWRFYVKRHKNQEQD